MQNTKNIGILVKILKFQAPHMGRAPPLCKESRNKKKSSGTFVWHVAWVVYTYLRWLTRVVEVSYECWIPTRNIVTHLIMEGSSFIDSYRYNFYSKHFFSSLKIFFLEKSLKIFLWLNYTDVELWLKYVSDWWDHFFILTRLVRSFKTS
jgi:hypothetical protein